MTKNSQQQKSFSSKEWQTIVKKFPEANFPQSPEFAKTNELLGNKVITEKFDGNGHAEMYIKNAKRGRYRGASPPPQTSPHCRTRLQRGSRA